MRKNLIQRGLAALIAVTAAHHAYAADGPAKQLFGAEKLPAMIAPQSAGFYSKGCLAGGVALPADGATWQVMRLSRNRNWGHPTMIGLLERLSKDAAKQGWPGLLVGDISQPRGGPMLTGHASHQVGLDADIWLTPMPSRTLTRDERENTSAISMLKGDTLYVDPDKWTPAHAAVIRQAARYDEVERIFVHPGIKKKLCDTATGDRSWLAKVRPYWGHHYHFHVRISCQPGSPNCKPQQAISKDEGCGKSLAWWFTDEPWKPAPKSDKPKPKPKVVMLSDLPRVCAQVLAAPGPNSVQEVTYGLSGTTDMPAVNAYQAAPLVNVPVPASKPLP
ncbi:MAG: penicillin-insensitive murein endopeptidase [Phyllobacterium sp.]